MLRKYNGFAQSVLYILCGNCHRQSTCLVPEDANQAEPLQRLIGEETFTAIQEPLNKFISGADTMDGFYNFLLSVCPTLNSGEDEQAWDIMKALLGSIADPERRATLQLRHFKSRPRMKTACCQYSHCWRCKTKNHDGKSCEELQSSLDNTVVPCPQCGISLTKADGCNSVTCFCGTQFGWSDQRKKIEMSTKFREAFPQNTTGECVRILTEETDQKLVDLSLGWKSVNVVDVNMRLFRWWITRFPFCAAQCAAHPPKDVDMFIGRRDALKLFKEKNVKAVQHCESESRATIANLFPSMFPSAPERAAVALSMRYSSAAFVENTAIVRSARMWAHANKEAMAEEERLFSQRSAFRLLWAFGSQTPKSMIGCSMISTVKDQCLNFAAPGVSNESLTYDSNLETAIRIGGVSCYPAAFVPLISSTCKVAFELLEGQLSVNYMSFGLCKSDFQKSSSDGFGRTRNSWGICDNRNTSASSETTFVGFNGNKVSECRKLVPGDIITLTVDLDRGSFNVDLNNGEYVHEFEVPSSESFESYYFGSTFANDHKIGILQGMDVISNPDCKVSSDQYTMVKSSVKALDDLVRNRAASVPIFFRQLTEEWERSVVEPRDRFIAYQELENLIPRDKTLSLKTLCDIPSLSEMSWKYLFSVMSWGALNVDAYEEYTREGLAMNHIGNHGDAAAFMAAEICHQAQTDKKVETSKNCKEARAYMIYFSEDMHAWYDYNNGLEDPIIPKSVPNCRCLPRHSRCACPDPVIVGGTEEAKKKKKNRRKKGKGHSSAASAGGASL